jgi:hypothetical protein
VNSGPHGGRSAEPSPSDVWCGIVRSAEARDDRQALHRIGRALRRGLGLGDLVANERVAQAICRDPRSADDLAASYLHHYDRILQAAAVPVARG